MNKNSVGHMKCQPPSVTATAAAVEVVLNSSNTSEEDVQEVPTPLVEDHLKRRVNDATELKGENAPEKLKEKHLVEVRKERHYHDDGEGNLLFPTNSSSKVETSICVCNYSQNENDSKIIENDKRIHSDSNSLLDNELKIITTSFGNKKRKLNEDKHKVCLVESCSYFGKPNPLISLDKVDSTNDNSEKISASIDDDDAMMSPLSYIVSTNDKINDEINDKNGKGSGMEEDEDAFSKPSASKRIKLDGGDDLLSTQRINDLNKIDEKQVDDVNINNVTVTDDNASSLKHNVKKDVQHPILNSASSCELITDGEVGVISVTRNKKCNKKYESNSDIVQISSSDDEDDEEEDDDEDDDGEDEAEDDDEDDDDDEEIVANDEEDVLCSYSPLSRGTSTTTTVSGNDAANKIGTTLSSTSISSTTKKTSLLPALALPITSTTSTLMTTKHAHVSGSCHECYMVEMKIVDLKINAIKTGTTQCIFSESCLLLKNSLRNLLGDAAPIVAPIHASCLESSNWTPLYGGSLIHMTLNLTGCHGNMVEFFGISRQLFDRYIAGKFPATTLQLYFEEHSMRPTLQQDFEKFFRSSYYVYNNFGNNAYDVLYPPAEYNNMNNSVSHVNTMYQQQQMNQFNSLINDAFVSRQDVSQQSKETLKHDDPYDKNVTKPQKAQRLKAKSLSLFHFEIHRSDKTAGNKFTFYRPPKWPYLKKVKNFTPISSSSNDKEKIKQVCCDDLNARMSFNDGQIHDNGSVKNNKEIWNSNYQHSQNSNQNSGNENSYFSQQQLQQYQHDNHFPLNNYSSSFNNYPTNLLNQANYNFQQMHLNNSNNNNLMYPHLNLAAQNFFQQQQLFGQWQNNVDFKLQQQHHQQQQQHFYHSKSPTYVQSGFTGNIVKLFTYRPANSKGGINITNEDLYCLNDGEYLNDVIIDFYLKYIMEELCTASDRDRTHIFSSFFYGHLMSGANNAEPNNNNLTPEERRHSKVKRWTRNVDIFSKDFIIVPINESYHWFLAIICFPNIDGITKCKSSVDPAHPSSSLHSSSSTLHPTSQKSHQSVTSPNCDQPQDGQQQQQQQSSSSLSSSSSPQQQPAVHPSPPASADDAIPTSLLSQPVSSSPSSPHMTSSQPLSQAQPTSSSQLISSSSSQPVSSSRPLLSSSLVSLSQQPPSPSSSSLPHSPTAINDREIDESFELQIEDNIPQDDEEDDDGEDDDDDGGDDDVANEAIMKNDDDRGKSINNVTVGCSLDADEHIHADAAEEENDVNNNININVNEDDDDNDDSTDVNTTIDYIADNNNDMDSSKVQEREVDEVSGRLDGDSVVVVVVGSSDSLLTDASSNVCAENIANKNNSNIKTATTSTTQPTSGAITALQQKVPLKGNELSMDVFDGCNNDNNFNDIKNISNNNNNINNMDCSTVEKDDQSRELINDNNGNTYSDVVSVQVVRTAQRSMKDDTANTTTHPLTPVVVPGNDESTATLTSSLIALSSSSTMTTVLRPAVSTPITSPSSDLITSSGLPAPLTHTPPSVVISTAADLLPASESPTLVSEVIMDNGSTVSKDIDDIINTVKIDRQQQLQVSANVEVEASNIYATNTTNSDDVVSALFTSSETPRPSSPSSSITSTTLLQLAAPTTASSPTTTALTTTTTTVYPSTQPQTAATSTSPHPPKLIINPAATTIEATAATTPTTSPETTNAAASATTSSCNDNIYKENSNVDNKTSPENIALSDECNPRNPCILIFDSLKGDNRYDVVNILRQYLQVEWNLKKRDVEGERVFDRISMKGSMVNCPQQPNSSDCGIYVLQYVESFFLNPISDFTLPLVLPNWFTSKQAMSKRLSLSKLVMKLQRDLNPTLKYNPAMNGCMNIKPILSDEDDDDDEEEDDEVVDAVDDSNDEDDPEVYDDDDDDEDSDSFDKNSCEIKINSSRDDDDDDEDDRKEKENYVVSSPEKQDIIDDDANEDDVASNGAKVVSSMSDVGSACGDEENIMMDCGDDDDDEVPANDDDDDGGGRLSDDDLKLDITKSDDVDADDVEQTDNKVRIDGDGGDDDDDDGDDDHKRSNVLENNDDDSASMSNEASKDDRGVKEDAVPHMTVVSNSKIVYDEDDDDEMDTDVNNDEDVLIR